MFKKVALIVIGIFFLAGIAYALIYLNINLNKLKSKNKALLEKLTLEDKEITELKLSLENKKKEVGKLKEELTTLSYPQRLKKALGASQKMISDLNTELNKAKAEAKSLREENLSLKNRVEINTKELSRLLKELQESKTKIAKLETRKMLSKEEGAKVDKYPREKKIKRLKQDLEKLTSKYNDLLKERNFLKKNIERYQKDLASKKPSKSWKRRIKELKASLEEKEEEKKQLQFKLSKLKREKDDLNDELEEKNKKLKELTLLNNNLQNQIIKLNSDLSQKNKEVYKLQDSIKESKVGNLDNVELTELKQRLRIQRERLKTVSSLYNRLRDQLKELSDMLYSKDSELDRKDEEIANLKDEISYLKIKSENLEEAFKISQENQKKILERLSQATNLNTNLQDKLGEVSSLLGEDFSKGRAGFKKIEAPKEGILTSPKTTTDKDTTDELRKKVEVILQSIQSE